MMTNHNEDDDLLSYTLEALCRGDFSVRMPAGRGRDGKIAALLNEIIEKQARIAGEISDVARIVGHEGQLAHRASLPGASGGWNSTIQGVNALIDDLVRPTREMSRVIDAVARGDMSGQITVDARGEILQLKNTINTMVLQLRSFASEVTRVAREVGTEGKLGGQARVEGVAGTWRDLTENVNQLAANLTGQVRAIADVATAVTRGDLSQSIRVEARGEVSLLKDRINEMIRNLKETTQENAEQDWLKGNLARITRLLQGQRDLKAVTSLILSELAPLVSAHHGVFYMADADGLQNGLRLVASYGYRARHGLPTVFMPGEGLVGQCAIEKQRIWLTKVPRDYILVSSGLGAAPPANIVVLPILFGQQVKAVLEIASLDRFTPTQMSFFDQLMESIGVVLNTIEANCRTETLLTQSQSLAQELQQTNLELAEKASLLSRQNIEVERKNREVEQAKLALEEKATQLALSSRYKSEFLANMSHELRTPLNSLLILSQQLSENLDGNLTPGQIEFARTIHGSGSDLLTLINDILDLSKVESGTVSLEMGELRFTHLRSYIERIFRHMAQARGLDFRIDLEDDLPPSLMIDMMRLQQILRNLLSNAFKFTETGEVSLTISVAQQGWTPDHPALASAQCVIAFAIADTGIGIANEKLRLIFEAFQQADGSTARRYGGTGLGLSISRELARLFNGEIQVKSVVGEGSVFTLYLPWHTPEFVQKEEQADDASECDDHSATPTSASTAIRLPSAMLAAPAVSQQLPFSTTGPGHDDDGDKRGNGVLDGRKVLIVDDDLRNIFALSCVMEHEKMAVVFAESGKDGIAILEADPDIELVLMDVMMPGMDGHDTTRAIRQIERFRDLPIITVTAKAMKGDREKGIAAGASDYITKPVDAMQMLEMVRRWLPGKAGKSERAHQVDSQGFCSSGGKLTLEQK